MCIVSAGILPVVLLMLCCGHGSHPIVEVSLLFMSFSELFSLPPFDILLLAMFRGFTLEFAGFWLAQALWVKPFPTHTKACARLPLRPKKISISQLPRRYG